MSFGIRTKFGLNEVHTVKSKDGWTTTVLEDGLYKLHRVATLYEAGLNHLEESKRIKDQHES